VPVAQTAGPSSHQHDLALQAAWRRSAVENRPGGKVGMLLAAEVQQHVPCRIEGNDPAVPVQGGLCPVSDQVQGPLRRREQQAGQCQGRERFAFGRKEQQWDPAQGAVNILEGVGEPLGACCVREQRQATDLPLGPRPEVRAVSGAGQHHARRWGGRTLLPAGGAGMGEVEVIAEDRLPPGQGGGEALRVAVLIAWRRRACRAREVSPAFCLNHLR
jgi:hypothetical protein